MSLRDFLRQLLSSAAGSKPGGRPAPRRRRPSCPPLDPGAFAAPTSRPFRRLMSTLGLRHVRVRKLIHSRRAYATFAIPKRSGGQRQICAPCKSLKHIQRRILRRIVEPLDRHDAAHGFRRRRSILTNAQAHAGKEMVLSLDLENFFPTITSQRVYGLLKALKWPANLASMLTRLVTWQGALPQGAPTSPALANLIARRLDCRLAGVARKRGLAYTRYADDLTFSGPADQVRGAFPMIRRVVEEEGLKLAEGKTRFMRRGRRQVVTGVTVNERPSVPRPQRRLIRAILHNIKMGRVKFDSPAQRAAALDQLEGHVNFIRSIRPEHAAPLKAKLAELRAAR